MEYRSANVARKPPIDLSALARRSINSDLIYPGDKLDVTLVTGGEETQPEPQTYRVDAQGNVALPLIGPVLVAGSSMTDAERRIQDASIERRIHRNPLVSVLMNKRKMDFVTVAGAVVEPGQKELPAAGSDLLAAIVAAGGLSEFAGTTIEIRHPALPATATQAGYEAGAEPAGPQALHVDLVDAMEGNAGDLRLRDGSVVMVHEHVPEKIYVTGLVAKSDAYELPKDEPLRVSQAIAQAGGRKLEIADIVHVTRRIEGQEDPMVIRVSLKEAQQDPSTDLILSPNDVVSVEETPLTFTIDTLRSFIRFGFSSTIPGL